MNTARPSSTDRFFGAGYYLGLGPLLRFWRSESSTLFLLHHFKQAMAALYLVFVVFLAAVALEGTECLILMWFPALVQRLADRFGSSLRYLDYIELLLFAGLGLVWFALLCLAVVGSLWPMPLFHRISRKPWFVRLSFAANVVLLALIPISLVFGFWATSLTRTCIQGANVYFLYDEGIAVPRWGYAMGLSRLALQARRNWGPGGVVLDHLTSDTLRTAFTSGRVVILATHGEAGYAATYFAREVVGVWPANLNVTDETGGARFLCLGRRGADNQWTKLENLKIEDQLQLVYVFACNAGKRATQWEEHLSPARVITYDRFSTVLDHALWFAFTGPSELKRFRTRPK